MDYKSIRIYIDVYEKNQNYTVWYKCKRRNNKHARKVTTGSRANIHIGVTAGQNDERGDQDVARMLDNNRNKTNFVRLSNMGFWTAFGGQYVSDNWGDQAWARTVDKQIKKLDFV